VNERIKQVIVPTLSYAVAGMVVLWLFVLQETVVPISFFGPERLVSLSFLGVPLLSALTSYYVSVMVARLLEGEAVEPLSEGLRRVALTSFLFFISDWPLLPQWLGHLTGFIFYSSILSLLHKTLSAVLEPINQLFEPMLSSLYILFVGFVGSRTWLQVYPYLEGYILDSGYAPAVIRFIQSGVAEPVNNVIVASTAIVSVLALTGVLRNHPNTYLRYLGEAASGRLEQATILTFLVLYYLFFVRSFLLAASGVNPQYVVVGEWAALCAGFYLSYRGLKRFTAESLVEEDLKGTWRRHMQQITFTGEPELEVFDALIERFVRDGEGEALIVHLTLLLEHSGMQPQAITAALSPIINHRDTPTPLIGFSWQTSNIRKMNAMRRKRIVNTVLGSIQLKPHGAPSETDQGQVEAGESGT
jgi:hypothetical protein